jgi:hypothetical protein
MKPRKTPFLAQIYDEQKEALENVKASTGTSVSELIREGIDLVLAHYGLVRKDSSYVRMESGQREAGNS